MIFEPVSLKNREQRLYLSAEIPLGIHQMTPETVDTMSAKGGGASLKGRTFYKTYKLDTTNIWDCWII